MAEALQGAGEDAVHAVRGIQRAVGILEDDLQGADQCLGAAARRKGRDVRPVVEGATVGGAVQAAEDEGAGRFSRAGLAQPSDGFDAPDVEGEAGGTATRRGGVWQY